MKELMILYFVVIQITLISGVYVIREDIKKIPNNPPIQKGFIYTQELKEDSSYELITYPSKDWTIVHK